MRAVARTRLMTGSGLRLGALKRHPPLCFCSVLGLHINFIVQRHDSFKERHAVAGMSAPNFIPCHAMVLSLLLKTCNHISEELAPDGGMGTQSRLFGPFVKLGTLIGFTMASLVLVSVISLQLFCCIKDLPQFSDFFEVSLYEPEIYTCDHVMYILCSGDVHDENVKDTLWTCDLKQ